MKILNSRGGTHSSIYSPLQKSIFGTSSQNLRKSRYPSSQAPLNLAWVSIASFLEITMKKIFLWSFIRQKIVEKSSEIGLST